MRAGLEKAFWPCRFEIMSRQPTIIIDGAHNKEGIESLMNTIKRHYPDKKGSILFTALKDKPLKEMIGLLDNLEWPIFFTEFEFQRSASAEELMSMSNAWEKSIVKDVDRFLQEHLNRIGQDELFVICGSLYFMNRVRRRLVEM